MTDLTELKRLAEAAGGGEWFYRPGDLDDWGDVRDANAFRICQARDPRKMGQAVEAAARETRTDPWEAPARHIASANPAAILSLIQRVEEAEADRELFATPIAILQERAREEGRLAGIEEAAKVADDRAEAYAHFANKHEGSPIGDSNTMRCGAASSIAQAIRALKEKAE